MCLITHFDCADCGKTLTVIKLCEALRAQGDKDNGNYDYMQCKDLDESDSDRPEEGHACAPGASRRHPLPEDYTAKRPAETMAKLEDEFHDEVTKKWKKMFL